MIPTSRGSPAGPDPGRPLDGREFVPATFQSRTGRNTFGPGERSRPIAALNCLPSRGFRADATIRRPRAARKWETLRPRVPGHAGSARQAAAVALARRRPKDYPGRGPDPIGRAPPGRDADVFHEKRDRLRPGLPAYDGR